MSALAEVRRPSRGGTSRRAALQRPASARQSGSGPRILIATALGWACTARLALAFSEAGAQVEAISTPGHALRRLRGAGRHYDYPVAGASGPLLRAIVESRCDLVVPGDDRAAGHIRRLHGVAGDPVDGLDSLIERSLGAAEGFSLQAARAPLIEAARAAGVRAPATRRIEDEDDLALFFSQNRGPAILKLDGAWGGTCAVVVADLAQARTAARHLSNAKSFSRTLKRRIADKEQIDCWPWSARANPIKSIQAFVAGRPANAAVACWRGEVLGECQVEAVRTSGPNGPATVVRRIESEEISRAVRLVVARLGLSGLCGLDFILSEAGGAYRVELNARATPTAHLASGAGPSPAALLVARVMGRPPHETDRPDPGETIALFPQEILRDPKSPFLTTARHDLPLRAPELLADGLALTRRRHGPVGRIVDGFRGRAAQSDR